MAEGPERLFFQNRQHLEAESDHLDVAVGQVGHAVIHAVEFAFGGEADETFLIPRTRGLLVEGDVERDRLGDAKKG